MGLPRGTLSMTCDLIGFGAPVNEPSLGDDRSMVLMGVLTGETGEGARLSRADNARANSGERPLSVSDNGPAVG
jgi:hypothetical protein